MSVKINIILKELEVMTEFKDITKSPPERYIALDTNAFWNDFYLTSVFLDNLRTHALDCGYMLLVPSIVRDEVFTNFEAQWDEAHQGFIDKFVYHSETFSLDDEKQKAMDRLNSQWSAFLESDSVELLDCSKVDLEAVIDRCVRKIQPFQSKTDKGFKDTLIWMSLVKFMTGKSGDPRLVLISNNTSDFSIDKRSLSPSLVAELDSLGVRSDYFLSIKHYMSSEFGKEEGVSRLRNALEESMPDLISAYFLDRSDYEDQIEEWIYSYTDIVDEMAMDVRFESLEERFKGLSRLSRGKVASSGASVVYGDVLVDITTSCIYANDVDYDGYHDYQEVDVKFSLIIPFTVKLLGSMDGEFEMPVLKEAILSQIEYTDDENSHVTVVMDK